jgi:hypothetical protein
LILELASMNCSRTIQRRQPGFLGWTLSILIAGTCSAVEPNRIWVDADGLFSVDARLIEIGEQKLVLLRPSGERVSIAIDKLSERDKEYLDEVQQRAVATDQSLRSGSPKTQKFRPLPVLDLPPADQVATDGSGLSWHGRARTKSQSKLSNALVPDPSPWVLAVPEARISVHKIDSNDSCSRPIPIVTASASGKRRVTIAMSVSSGVQFSGQNRPNQLLRFNVETRKAEVAFKSHKTIRLIDHHLASGRSLLLVGFDSLGKGGELAVGSGWNRRFKLSHLRKLSTNESGATPHLRWARWIDEEHFVAVIDQTLGLWNIISGDQVYGIDGIDHRAEPALSGGRRFLAIPYEGEVQLIAATTGQALGRIQIEKQVPGVSFSPQADKLAIVTSRRLQTWDLPTAAQSSDIKSHRNLGTGYPIWIDSDLIMSSSGVLLSVFRKLPIWRYDIAATETAAVGRRMVVFRKHPVTELSIMPLPHEGATNAMQWIDNSPATVDRQQWRILGHSLWKAGSWDDRDVQISAAPARRR